MVSLYKNVAFIVQIACTFVCMIVMSAYVYICVCVCVYACMSCCVCMSIRNCYGCVCTRVREANLPVLRKEGCYRIGENLPLIINIFQDISGPLHQIADFVARRRSVNAPDQLLFHFLSQNILQATTNKRMKARMNERKNERTNAYLNEIMNRSEWQATNVCLLIT